MKNMTDIINALQKGEILEANDGLTKYNVYGNVSIGRFINFTVERYDVEEFYAGGCMARNGWHESPKLVRRTRKKPTSTRVVTEKEIKRLVEMFNLDFFVI